MYFCRKHVALSYTNHLCLPAFCFLFKAKKNFNQQTIFVLFKHSNEHPHFQAKQSTSSFFKQSNQHHHFSSKAINIIIFQAKQSTSSFFKQSSIIIVQAKQAASSFFKQHHHFLSISLQLFAGILSITSVDIFGLGSIIILFKQTVLRQAPEMYIFLSMPCDSRG